MTLSVEYRYAKKAADTTIRTVRKALAGPEALAGQS